MLSSHIMRCAPHAMHTTRARSSSAGSSRRTSRVVVERTSSASPTLRAGRSWSSVALAPLALNILGQKLQLARCTRTCGWLMMPTALVWQLPAARTWRSGVAQQAEASGARAAAASAVPAPAYHGQRKTPFSSCCGAESLRSFFLFRNHGSSERFRFSRRFASFTMLSLHKRQ